jgi:tRNA(Ser,Leu) C12 N-acetylase TAN1
MQRLDQQCTRVSCRRKTGQEAGTPSQPTVDEKAKENTQCPDKILQIETVQNTAGIHIKPNTRNSPLRPARFSAVKKKKAVWA